MTSHFFRCQVAFCRNLFLPFCKIFWYNTVVVRKRQHLRKKIFHKAQKNLLPMRNFSRSKYKRKHYKRKSRGSSFETKIPFSFLWLFLKDYAPGLFQAVHLPGCIGRTCGWKFFYRTTSQRKGIFLIKLKSFSSIGIDFPYGCRLKDTVQIRRHNISDAAVAGSNNLTTGNHIPDGNPIFKQ